MVETVDHPRHYGGDTPYEVIKVLEAWLTPEMFKGFLVGNVLNYSARAHLKGNEAEDRRKALWYQDYLIKWEERRQLAPQKITAGMLPGTTVETTVEELRRQNERTVPRYGDDGKGNKFT